MSSQFNDWLRGGWLEDYQTASDRRAEFMVSPVAAQEAGKRRKVRRRDGLSKVACEAGNKRAAGTGPGFGYRAGSTVSETGNRSLIRGAFFARFAPAGLDAQGLAFARCGFGFQGRDRRTGG